MPAPPFTFAELRFVAVGAGVLAFTFTACKQAVNQPAAVVQEARDDD